MKFTHKDVQEGVEEAFAGYAEFHSVSFPETIQLGVKEAMSAWLSEHSDEIVEAIVKKWSKGV